MGEVLLPISAKDRIESGPAFYLDPIEKAGFGEAAKAAFVEENAIAQYLADLEYQTEADAIDGYDQYQDIPEELGHLPLTTWRNVTSPAMMQSRIAEVRAELDRRATMATNGWGSFIGAMGGYLLSPETIPELLLTQGASGVAGAVRVGVGALAFESAHEVAMHEQSYTRTWQESMTNIGLSAFAGAGLGYLVGSGAKRRYLRDLTREMQETASPGAYKSVDQTGGAAMVGAEGEEIIDKPWIRWGRLGPVRSIAHATSKVAQRMFNDTLEHSYQPAKTLQGKARQIALETQVNQEIAQITSATHSALTKGYKEWAKEGGIGAMSRHLPKNWNRFQTELHMAMVRGDSSTSAAVQKTAKALRTEYDKVYDIAKQAREINPNAAIVDLDEFLVKFADSYAPRRYNKSAIRKDKIAFKEALETAFKQQREMTAWQEAIQAEAKAAEAEGRAVRDVAPDEFLITDEQTLSAIRKDVNESYNRIVNNFDLDVHMAYAERKSGDPFKERKIPLRDEDMIARGWLDSDIQSMTMNYVNRVLKPSRMIMTHGDTEMTASLQRMVDEYGAMERAAEKAGDLKTAQRIEREMNAVKTSFETWRDRWYGRSTISSNRWDEAINDIMRTIRNLNVARMMGMVTLISAGDAARMNLSTIFAPELGKRAPGLFKAINTARLSAKEFERIGIAHETAMHVRTGKIMDDSGMMEGSHKAVQWSSAMSRGLMRASHLAHWTDWMKETAAAYTQNDIIQKMRGYSRLSPKSKAQLAQLGIDEDMAKRLQAEIAASKARTGDAQSVIPLGRDDLGYEGIGYVLRFENFDDQVLAERISQVMFRESEKNIVTPAAGDIPKIFRSEEANKMMFQFQSFLFAASTSITPVIARKLRLGDPKAAVILSNMMLMGLVAVGLRNAAYGRAEEMAEWTPMDMALNAFDYSTVGPLFMMGFNYVNLFTGNGLVNALGAESMVRFQHHPMGSVAGPWVGTVNDAMLAAASLGGIPFGEELTPTDIRRMRRLLPWNNLAYVSAGVTEATKAVEEVVQ
jgi:hypothetical protein